MNRIKELREKNGILQKELADMIGVNYVSVSKWEENLQKLAEILHCEPEEIIEDIKKDPENSIELSAGEKKLIQAIREIAPDKRDVALLTAEIAIRGQFWRDLMKKLDDAEDMAERIIGATK